MHKIIRALCLVLLPLIPGCDEEEPTGAPHVVGALAECRTTGDDSGYRLVRVEVVVRDLDGPDHVLDPQVLAEGSVPLAMVRQEPVESEGCPSGRPICQVVFTWMSTPNNEALFCGEDGKSLQLSIEVEDGAGLEAVAAVQSNPT